MIMDSFASLALATEDPRPDLLTRKPYPRDQPLLSRRMLRFMLGHGFWQLVVLTFLIFRKFPAPASSDDGLLFNHPDNP